MWNVVNIPDMRGEKRLSSFTRVSSLMEPTLRTLKR